MQSKLLILWTLVFLVVAGIVKTWAAELRSTNPNPEAGRWETQLRSPDGRWIMQAVPGGVERLEVKTGQRTRIFSLKETLSEPALLGWSRDSGQFWFSFTEQESGPYEGLGCYSNGQLKKIEQAETQDSALNLNHGWLVQADTPWCYASTDLDDLKTNQTVYPLWLYDLPNHRKVQLASQAGRLFRPGWSQQDTLVIETPQGDRTFLPDQLAARLKADGIAMNEVRSRADTPLKKSEPEGLMVTSSQPSSSTPGAWAQPLMTKPALVKLLGDSFDWERFGYFCGYGQETPAQTQPQNLRSLKQAVAALLATEKYALSRIEIGALKSRLRKKDLSHAIHWGANAKPAQLVLAPDCSGAGYGFVYLFDQKVYELSWSADPKQVMGVEDWLLGTAQHKGFIAQMADPASVVRK